MQNAFELIMIELQSVVRVSLELCLCKSILCYWPNHQGQGYIAVVLGRASMHLTEEIRWLCAERDDVKEENCGVKLVRGHNGNPYRQKKPNPGQY